MPRGPACCTSCNAGCRWCCTSDVSCVVSLPEDWVWAGLQIADRLFGWCASLQTRPGVPDRKFEQPGHSPLPACTHRHVFPSTLPQLKGKALRWRP